MVDLAAIENFANKIPVLNLLAILAKGGSELPADLAAVPPDVRQAFLIAGLRAATKAMNQYAGA